MVQLDPGAWRVAPAASPRRDAATGIAGPLLVVGEDGRSIAGARLSVWPAPARQVARERLSALATSDARGMLVVPPGRDSAEGLIVHRDGFVTTPLSAMRADDGGRRLVLAAGHRLEFECRLADGTPLTGARIDLVRALMPAVDSDDDGTGWVAAADADRAMYSAVSDGRGRAELGSLPSGRYAVRALHPTAALVARIPEPGMVEAPGPGGGFTFSRMCVAAVLPPAGSLTHNASQQQVVTARGLTIASEVLARRRLAARFPTALIAVIVPPGDRLPEPLRYAFLIDGRGWCDVDVPWCWVDELEHPFEPAGNLPIEPLAFGRLAVELRNPDGSVHRPCAIQVQRLDSAGLRSAGGLLPDDGRMPLPVGEYRLRSFDGFESLMVSRAATVRVLAGQEAVLRFTLPVALRRCRLRVDRPAGIGALVTVEDMRRERLSHPYRIPARAGEATVSLPCSQLRIAARVPGVEIPERVLEVVPGGDDLVIDLGPESGAW